MRRFVSAFTLVELLIVITVIAVLAAVVVPKFQQSSLKAREAALKANLKHYRGTIARYYADTGLYPMVAEDVTEGTAPALGLDIAGNVVSMPAALWQGPYISAVEDDPVSGLDWNYSTTPPTVGRIRSKTPGNASDGTLYITW